MECSIKSSKIQSTTSLDQNKTSLRQFLPSTLYPSQQEDPIYNQEPQHRPKKQSKVYQKFKNLQSEATKFRKIFSQIQPRGLGFYRFGFKSFEKQNNKNIFGQALNIPIKDLKGSIFLGELWSNKQTSHFIKQNGIKMNKLKLMDKLQTYKKNEEIKEVRRSFRKGNSSMEDIQIFRENFSKTLSSGSFKSSDLRKNSTNSVSDNKIHRVNRPALVKDLQQIRGKISTLQKQYTKQNHKGLLRQLQGRTPRMDRMWNRMRTPIQQS